MKGHRTLLSGGTHRRSALVLLTMVWTCGAAFSEVPQKTENLVYSIRVFDGSTFRDTFAVQNAPVMYLPADTPSLIAPRKTIVYYWPTTERWTLDTRSLNEELDGVLEIADSDGNPVTLTREQYAIATRMGAYAAQFEIYTGEESEAVFARYQLDQVKYLERLDAHEREQGRMERRLFALLGELRQEERPQSEARSLLLEIAQIRESLGTSPPLPPQYAVQRPTKSFVFGLPPGRYSMRMLTEGGRIIEGSEKEIVVFPARRVDEIAYEIIPADRWTRRSFSMPATDVLYVNGNADLYIRPFYADEYNDLYYAKAIDNQGRGSSGLFRWVVHDQVPSPAVRLSGARGGADIITEEPFLVQQVEGASLGYRIVPILEDSDTSGTEPTLVAMRIAIDRATPALSIDLLTADNQPIAGGHRRIRVVDQSGRITFSLIIVLAPFPVWLSVRLARSRHLRKRASTELSRTLGTERR